MDYFDYKVSIYFDDSVYYNGSEVIYPFNGAYLLAVKHRIKPTENYSTSWEPMDINIKPILTISRIGYNFREDKFNEIIKTLGEFIHYQCFVSAEIELTTFKGDTFFATFQPSLYHEYDGKIPYKALLISTFHHSAESEIQFYKEILIDGLKEIKVDISDYFDNHFLISKKGTSIAEAEIDLDQL